MFKVAELKKKWRGKLKDGKTTDQYMNEIRSKTEDGVIIKPVGEKEYSLKELVKGITPQNRHSEVDFGHPVYPEGPEK